MIIAKKVDNNDEKIFYIQVSSYDQSIERQLIAAKELGNIYLSKNLAAKILNDLNIN